jgi:hypothetical protein
MGYPPEMYNHLGLLQIGTAGKSTRLTILLKWPKKYRSRSISHAERNKMQKLSQEDNLLIPD